jgi:DNA mismatch repair protein MSH6
MCGINGKIIDRAEEAARMFEHTSKLKESLEAARSGVYIPLGIQSDLAYYLSDEGNVVSRCGLETLLAGIEAL